MRYFLLFLIFITCSLCLHQKTHTNYNYTFYEINTVSLYNLQHIFDTYTIIIDYPCNANIVIFHMTKSDSFDSIYNIIDREEESTVFDRYNTPYIIYSYNSNHKQSTYEKMINAFSEQDTDICTVEYTINVYGIASFYSLFYTEWLNGYCENSIGIYKEEGTRVDLFIEMSTNNDQHISILLSIIGLFTYLFSRHISQSRILYICFCTLFGAVMCLIVLLIFTVYIVSKQMGIRGWISGSFTISIIAFISSFGTEMIYNYELFLFHPYFICIIGVGAFVGLYYGYTKELDQRQKDLTYTVICIFSILILIHTIQINEITMLILLLFSRYCLLLLYFVTRPIRHYLTILRYKIYRPKKKMLTMDEYNTESSEATNEGIESIIYQCKNNPSILARLSEHARSRIRRINGGDNHLSVILEDMDKNNEYD